MVQVITNLHLGETMAGFIDFVKGATGGHAIVVSIMGTDLI